MNLFNELKRRHVFRIGIAYLVVAWLVTQVVVAISPVFDLPQWFPRTVLILLAVGFPIALVVAWAFEMTPEGVKRTDDLDEAAPRRVVTTGRKLDFVIIGALVLAVGFLVWRLSYGPAATETAVSHATASASTAAKPTPDVLPNSVAVLPFQNLSPDPKDAYFAAGLHEEVIDQLSKIHSMSVIARASVMQYAKGTTPIPEIAHKLRVGTVMEGSVRFADHRVRVSAQLVDPKTDTNLWSDTYERPLGDVFKIEADIAMNVADALKAKFSPEEQARIERAPTKSPDAFALYLQALTAADRGDNTKTLSLLKQAIAIDPQFALAYAHIAYMQAIALVNSTAGNAISPDQRSKLAALSRKNAERAIEIDPDVGFAHGAFAIPDWVSWRWSEAAKAFARALDVSPNAGLAGYFYVWLLSWTDHHEEAIAMAKRSVELNPAPSNNDYGLALGMAGEYTAAKAEFERLIAAQPQGLQALTRNWLAFMDIATGDPDAASSQLQLLQQLIGPNPAVVFLPEWAYIYARAGRPADAKRLFDRLKKAADKGAMPGAGGWAMAYLAIGDEKQARDWLEKAAEKAANHEPDEGLYNLMNLKLNVTNDPVLKKPEFVDVLSRIKGD